MSDLAQEEYGKIRGYSRWLKRAPQHTQAVSYTHLFVNDKELMHFSYTRYLENKIRDAFDFGGTPLKFIVRERGEKE